MCTYRFDDPELQRSFFREVFGVVAPVATATEGADAGRAPTPEAPEGDTADLRLELVGTG